MPTEFPITSSIIGFFLLILFLSLLFHFLSLVLVILLSEVVKVLTPLLAVRGIAV
jgi:uncharacterized membrane protein